jgi:hypothetical protein
MTEMVMEKMPMMMLSNLEKTASQDSSKMVHSSLVILKIYHPVC